MPRTLWILTLPTPTLCLIWAAPSLFRILKNHLCLLDNAVDLVGFTGVLGFSYSSPDILLNMIKILFLETFDVFFASVYLYAIYKHRFV